MSVKLMKGGDMSEAHEIGKNLDTETVEKVARAITIALGYDPDSLSGIPFGNGEWEPCLIWERYIPAAKAAINEYAEEHNGFGILTERVIATAGDNIPAEIEFIDKHGNVVGFWAYGHFHPDYPYRG